ncbi:phosphoribosylformylglycinamidine synthase subunit PurQ [Candidatus Roizmanbacteria bacterium]|nr:phosphoribosylformylglycinamidine synthase subunit PurQ [Candidatus Roizmanbacteria bacterium]
MADTDAEDFSMKENGPPFAVLTTDGSNCDKELAFAFQDSGADIRIVHINELKRGDVQLRDFRGLGLPGGFTYGDVIRAGKLMAKELEVFLADDMNEFIHRYKGLVLGICNGFQTAVLSGLFPDAKMGDSQVALQTNKSGHFQCQWVNVKFEHQHTCVFLQNQDGKPISLPIAHGQGNFYAKQEQLARIENGGGVVLRYCTPGGETAFPGDPANPNGSLNGIAAVTDLRMGHTLFMMTHPERAFKLTQIDNWRRKPKDFIPPGRTIIGNMVLYASEM